MVAVIALVSQTSTPLAGAQDPPPQKATGLVEDVRNATSDFQDVAVAMAAGYAPATGTLASRAPNTRPTRPSDRALTRGRTTEARIYSGPTSDGAAGARRART